MLPTVNEYREALLFERALIKYESLVPLKDSTGNPIFSLGDFAVVFKMQDKTTKKLYALKCFTHDQEFRHESYSLISKHLNRLNHPYLVPFEYLKNEIRVNSHFAGNGNYPVLLMEWVDGLTLRELLYVLCKNNEVLKLQILSNIFDQMALWLLEQPFAHGDLSLDNILVEANGQLRLVDYDNMYTPEMAGQKAREFGTKGFCHPDRGHEHFFKYIDDFSILLISFVLNATAEHPSFFIDKNLKYGGWLIENDRHDIRNAESWNAISKVITNRETLSRLVSLCIAALYPPDIPIYKLHKLLRSRAESSHFYTGEICWKGTTLSSKLYYAVKINIGEYFKIGYYQFGDTRNIFVNDYNRDENLFAKLEIGQTVLIPRSKVIFLKNNENNITIENESYQNTLFQTLLQQHDDAEPFYEELFKVFLNEKYGLINSSGNFITPIKYDCIRKFSDGYAAVRIGDPVYGLWGFIDESGEEVFSCQYDRVNDFQDGIAKIFKVWGIGDNILESECKYGLIDKDGTTLIRPLFDPLYNISDLKGLRIFKDFSENVLIDHVGKEIIVVKNNKKVSNKFCNVKPISEGMAAVKFSSNFRNGQYWSYINTQVGQEKYTLSGFYSDTKSYSEGLAAVKFNDKWGFIDHSGEKVITYEFDDVKSFREGLAAVCLNGKWGYIDHFRNEIVPFEYDVAKSFRNGFAKVCVDEKFGLIDAANCERIPIIYENIRRRKYEIVAYKQNGKWGLINRFGKVISDAHYDNVPYFASNQIARMKKNDKYILINSYGTEIVKFEFEEIWDFNEGLACVKYDNKWGYINKSGDLVIPCKYEKAYEFYDGRAEVHLNDKQWFIDKNDNLYPWFDNCAVYDEELIFSSKYYKFRLGM